MYICQGSTVQVVLKWNNPHPPNMCCEPRWLGSTDLRHPLAYRDTLLVHIRRKQTLTNTKMKEKEYRGCWMIRPVSGNIAHDDSPRWRCMCCGSSELDKIPHLKKSKDHTTPTVFKSVLSWYFSLFAMILREDLILQMKLWNLSSKILLHFYIPNLTWQNYKKNLI